MCSGKRGLVQDHSGKAEAALEKRFFAGIRQQGGAHLTTGGTLEDRRSRSGGPLARHFETFQNDFGGAPKSFWSPRLRPEVASVDTRPGTSPPPEIVLEDFRGPRLWKLPNLV